MNWSKLCTGPVPLKLTGGPEMAMALIQQSRPNDRTGTTVCVSAST